MPKSISFGDFAIGVTLTCVLLLTGLTLKREFSAPSSPDFGEPEFVEGWEEFLLERGHTWGDPASPVTVVEFSDFECPACRSFALGAAEDLKARFPEEVLVVTRHWPLPYHRLSWPAARAAECAAEQGRFHRFYSVLFQQQDSLGLKSFRDFAAEVGVADLERFEECSRSDAMDRRIAQDTLAVRRAGGRGTPTIVVNGWRLAGAPTAEDLAALVEELLAEAGAR